MLLGRKGNMRNPRNPKASSKVSNDIQSNSEKEDTKMDEEANEKGGLSERMEY